MSIVHIVFAIAALVIVGLLAGSIARSLVPGRVNLSVRATAVLGIAGSFLGALILWFVSSSTAVSERYGVLAAVAGSVLLLVLCRIYNPKIVSDRTIKA